MRKLQLSHSRIGRRQPVALVVLLVFALLLAGCGSLNLFGGRAELIGERKAEDPMAAAEAYMRQYQPGPLPRVFQTTRIYDRRGRLLAETFGEGRRVWVSLDKVSPHLIDATVAVEDATFFTNPGVDAGRIAGAAIQNLQEGGIVSGASTITMQLARNLFLGVDQRYDQSFDRKVLEAGLAQELTDLYDKDELLEMYLNLLNYGQLAYGPEAAAQVYFGKSAADLTAAEAALLAGIPQQPAYLNPYDDFEAAKRRQRIVLDLMARHGYLTESEADALYDEPLELAGDRGLAPNLTPHFVQYVIERMNVELGEGYVQRAGFQVYTTLDLDLQNVAQQIVADWVTELEPVYGLSNAALTVLANGTAEILAMVGSADFDNDAIAGQVNVAISSRQPGSAIKPILYAAAIDDNLVSPASVLWDVPVTYTVGLPQSIGGSGMLAGDALTYRPQNYDETFHGPVTVRSALANSYNIPTVKLLDALGVERMLEVARAMGVRSLDQSSDWYGLSLTLGGGEVTLLDLTTAYHTLANAGQYVPPQYLVSLHDSQGRILEERASVEPLSVLAADTAFLVTDMLSDNRARTPAFGERSPLALSRPAAAKTGTTNDWRDNWTVGYTRYLTAGVWAGNSDGRPMRNVSGVTGAAPIWHDFMEAALAQPELLAELGAPDSPAGWTFEAPEDVVQLPDCPPGLACREGGELFRRSWVEQAGREDLLYGSVARTAAAPVIVQQGDEVRLAGFCEVEGAAERTMLTLPGTIGLPDPAALTSAIALSAEAELQDAVELPSYSLEQLHALAWSLRHGTNAVFGPCAALKDAVPAALALEAQPEDGGMRVLVDLAGAGNPDVSTLNVESAVELASIQGPLEVGLAGPGSFGLGAPVVHDWACPGQYVMGQVVNRDGAPLAGVRIVMRDPWGNQSETMSKGGSNDYGQFDFPIWADGPQDLVLTVVDESGNPLSAPISIPHKKDAAADAPCHHVTLRGG
ncbi:MAG: transglycosylase domain-containing protein [Chloroflexota bacterium]|nr:transglycosylase domain-containing protein [Chloroflexota bacterium]